MTRARLPLATAPPRRSRAAAAGSASTGGGTANLVGFRNEVWGTGVTDYWTNGSTQLAYGRGDRGYVVFNRTGSAVTRTFQTSLPAGTYCDVTADGCRAYQVNGDGTFTATVGPNGVFALHTGARA